MAGLLLSEPGNRAHRPFRTIPSDQRLKVTLKYNKQYCIQGRNTKSLKIKTIEGEALCPHCQKRPKNTPLYCSSVQMGKAWHYFSYTEYKNTLLGQNSYTITASHFGQIMSSRFQIE